MRWHQPTRDYVERRTTDGKTKPEIIRCLKRYIAREVYAALTSAGPATAETQEPSPQPPPPLPLR